MRASRNPLISLRQSKNINREDAAKACGLTVGSFCSLEGGQIMPTPHAIAELSGLYGVTYTELELRFLHWRAGRLHSALTAIHDRIIRLDPQATIRLAPRA